MPQPYNYGVPNPMQGFLRGLQVIQAMDQQKAAQEQARRRSEIMGNLIALGPNATAEDHVKASLALPEDAALFKQSWEMRDEGQRNALFRAGSDAYMLADSNPEGAVAKLEEYALGFDNAGDKDAAKQLRDAAQVVKTNPQAAKATIGMMLAFADGERFKNIAQTSENTPFIKDHDFIKNTYGDDAAAEFAQYGRGGVVSVPLGNGQTYVGPASSAPGSVRWQERGGEPVSVSGILQSAAENKSITKAESNMILQSLGPNGKAKYEEWLSNNGIKVIERTGTDADGRKVIQYTDGSWAYGD